MRTRPNMLPVAAAALGMGTVLAQPAPAPTSSDPEAQLVARIAELRADAGPTPLELIEPLRALALLYEEAGNHTLAVVALEEARHVIHVHSGLSSADEALLLRQQIRSEEARGNHQQVWNLQQDMVTLARQHHDDIRMAQIFHELADDRWNVLEDYRTGGLPPQIYYGCYYAAVQRRYDDTRGERLPAVGGSCQSGSRSVVVEQIRSEIQMYYADAIEVIVKNGDYGSDELRELEREASFAFPASPYCADATLDELLSFELLGTCLEPVIHEGEAVVANVGGSIGLARSISYAIRSGAPAAVRAEAIAELADWHLLSARRDRRTFSDLDELALDTYERALRELRQGRDMPAATAQIFAPEIPVTLPAYLPNRFAAAATAVSPRYIDVAFAVTRYGRGERNEVLATSKDATRDEKRDVPASGRESSTASSPMTRPSHCATTSASEPSAARAHLISPSPSG